MAYYNKHVNEILQEFSTSVNGLSRQEAAFRLEKYGPNELGKKKGFDALKSFVGQFSDLLIIILILASVISLIFGEKNDAVVMFAIVMLNTIIGFFQEYKASKSIDALKNMITPVAKVIREGKPIEIHAKEVAVGDILLLDEGCRIVADARLIEEHELRTDESVLTGESLPQKKHSQMIAKMELIAADQKNMVFMGTNVTHGNAYAVVTATGKNTEFGKLVKATEEIKDEKSPLQKEINYIGQLTAKATVIIGIFVVILGIIRGEGFFTIFLFAISLAVAVVPEGLPTTLSVSLALGVQRMAKERAIVRKLSSVETLGSTTVICSDKTGTLTKNQMTVKKIWAEYKMIDVTGAGYDPKGEFLEKGKKLQPHDLNSFHLILNIASLCNNAKLFPPNIKRHGWEIIGDPTEGALIVAAEKMGIKHDVLLGQYRRITEIPFDSEKKRMITVHRYSRENFAFLKGAPIEVLSICDSILINGKTQRISEKTKKEIMENVKLMAGSALRVLGFGYKKISDDFTQKNLEKEYVFVGLMGLFDPPRLEVGDAVKRCREAGIKINIITGDFGETAVAIAKDIGLADDNTAIITGEELDRMDETRLQELLKNECIFARASPEHKLRIITQLQEMGEVVAVTGDGVNDAPALKKANIGVSMGIAGTDVARESSNMVLADDSFATIVSAVRQGRRIYENIKKLIHYIYCGISAELFVVFISLFLGFLFGFPLPLLAIQILLIDLGAEVLPAIALAFEPEEEGVMRKKPRNPNYRIMNKEFITRFVFLGFVTAIGTLFLFYKTLSEGGWQFGMDIGGHSALYIKATTITFVSIIIFQMINAFNSKTESESIFSAGFFKNKFLILAVFASVLMVFAFTAIPFFNEALHTAPLTPDDWKWITSFSISIFLIEEVRKLIVRAYFKESYAKKLANHL